MDTDLATRLDRSIGPAPEAPDPLAAVLADGKRAVRRRRVAAVVASAVAAVVVAGGTALAVSGPDDSAAPPVASEPPSTAVPTTDVFKDPPASYDLRTGELVLGPGVRVVRQVDDPYGLGPSGGRSVALVLDVGGEPVWRVLVLDARGIGSGATVLAEAEEQSFEEWVASARGGLAVSDEDEYPGTPADVLVDFVADTEELAPAAGVQILEQRAGVDVGASFAGPEARTAAARVVTTSGTTVWVLVRAFPGEPAQVISVPLRKGGADLEAFLDYARDRYGEGEGGLL